MANAYNCEQCKDSKTIIFKAKATLSDGNPYDIEVIFVKTKSKQKIDIRAAIRKIELQIGKKVKSYSGTLTYTKCGCVVDSYRVLQEA